MYVCWFIFHTYFSTVSNVSPEACLWVSSDVKVTYVCSTISRISLLIVSVLSIQDRTQQFFFGCPLSIIYGNVSNFEYQSDYNIMKKYPCVHDLYVPNYARKANMNTKKGMWVNYKLQTVWKQPFQYIQILLKVFFYGPWGPDSKTTGD